MGQQQLRGMVCFAILLRTAVAVNRPPMISQISFLRIDFYPSFH